MCGRFALTISLKALQDFMEVFNETLLGDRYNIAPTQPILIVVEGERPEPGSNMPARRAMLARWGFIPGWVKDPRDFPLLINARSETAIEKASFRAAMRHRRILIPATGFYEWHRPPKESGEKPQAYWIKPKHGEIVAFAGLMETWASADGSEVDTAAILTTAANSAIGHIHDRMPVVIKPEDFSRWLDCKTQEPRQVTDLMQPVEDDFFEAVPVSDLVNKVANIGPEIQQQVDPSTTPPNPQRPPKKEKANKRGPDDEDGQLRLL